MTVAMATSVRSFMALIAAATLGAAAAGWSAAAAVIEVPPGPAAAVSAAVAAAGPGDRIQLQAGTYSGTVEIQSSGAHDRPIVIAGPGGAGPRALIDGLGTPGKGRANEAFRIRESSWVVIRDIDAVNCWTNVVEIRDSSYISVQSCRFLDCGRTAVSANGARSHHILVEQCRWTQDERVYSTWDWNELHHGEQEHYNGGIYGGTNAAGAAVVRFNEVRNVFNGLRWWMRKEHGEERRYQSNIEIYGNIFDRCRDNGIEPEVFTWNLHIYHNELNTIPAAVSIDTIRGGDIYFYGNTGVWRAGEKIGPKGEAEPVKRPWTTYKFAAHERGVQLDYPLYIFHNSWDSHQTFARGGRQRKATDRVIHLNNAIRHQTAHFGLVDWPGEHCEFDYDISSSPWRPDVLKAGFQRHGIEATDPKFRASAEGDFRLRGDSMAICAGKVIDGFTLWYLGDGPDMGAYEGGQRVYGLPFMHRDPPGGALYAELPRVVRIFSRGRKLAVFFSAPLDPDGIDADSVRLSAGGRALGIEQAEVAGGSRQQVLQILLDTPMPDATDVLDTGFGESVPRGVDGAPATLWGADARVVRVPEGATLTEILDGLL
ncbi:hypothetical protein BH23VER1_BH23VER1_31150 [soil metagenome]